MDLIITTLPVVTKDLPIPPRFTPYDFSSRCKFSTLTTRQTMVDLCSPLKVLTLKDQNIFTHCACFMDAKL